MSKHTPGSWARTNLMIHTVSTSEMPSLKIAKVFDYGETDAVRSPEEAEANAYLMEAAPDLLEACKAAVEDRAGWINLADAAIAKAEAAGE